MGQGGVIYKMDLDKFEILFLKRGGPGVTGSSGNLPKLFQLLRYRLPRLLLWMSFKVFKSCFRDLVGPFTRWGGRLGERLRYRERERVQVFPLSTSKRYISPVQGNIL